MILGLIPARGGSKRLPRKNVRMLCGRPLIAWTIIEAKRAGRLDRVVVTTEDDEIAEMTARYYGCAVIRRPAHMASDLCSIYHCILLACARAGPAYDVLTLLHPTSPLRLAEDIDAVTALCVDQVTVPAAISVETGKDVPNAAVYSGRVSWLRDGGCFDDPSLLRYEMPAERSVDINTLEDFERAEAEMKKRIAPVDAMFG